jgi:hypothetical protein
MFVEQPPWPFVVGAMLALSFPMIRVSPYARIGGRRRHRFILRTALAVNVVSVVVAGVTVSRMIARAYPAVDSLVDPVVQCTLIFACALNALSAIAHVLAMVDPDNESKDPVPPRSRSDEVNFLTTWLALPCLLVAAVWVTSGALSNPFVVLLSVWLVVVFAALIFVSRDDENAIAGLKATWSNLLALGVAGCMLAGAWGILAAQASAAADAMAWLSAIVGVALAVLTSRAIVRISRRRAAARARAVHSTDFRG